MFHNSAMKTKAPSLTSRQKRIYAFLSSNQTGVLASVDPNGEPHGSVIYYTVSEKDFSVSFITKTGTKKYDNLVRHAHVMLVVFDAQKQTVAQVRGVAQEVTDLRTVFETAGKISQVGRGVRQDEDLPISKVDAGDYAVFKIVPVQIRIAEFAQPAKSDSYSHMFDSIESFEFEPGKASQ